jgi:hypothetical protein
MEAQAIKIISKWFLIVKPGVHRRLLGKRFEILFILNCRFEKTMNRSVL